LWFCADWASVLPHQLINKYRYEANLTYKHLLHRMLENYWGRHAPYKPVTYNSQTQLAEFMGDYLTRQQKHEENTWMAKSGTGSGSRTKSLCCIFFHSTLFSFDLLCVQ
jgi:hypothetical protein